MTTSKPSGGSTTPEAPPDSTVLTEQTPEAVARRVRARVLELTLKQDGCYLSQALSSAEILATLYTRVLQLAAVPEPLPAPQFTGVPGTVNPSPSGGRFHGEQRPGLDRFLISPAHYAVAIYAALESVGRLEPGAFETFNTDGSTLEMIGAEHSPGFELTTGSFGQALSQSAGIAVVRQRRGEAGRTVVFMSDGELEEGQTWEAAQAVAHYRLNNLILFVDVNGQQVDGLTKDIMSVEPIDARFAAFGWNVVIVNGHDPVAIEHAVTERDGSRPLVVLCYTDTAHGVPYLDARKPNLHYVRPKDDTDRRELRAALTALTGEQA